MQRSHNICTNKINFPPPAFTLRNIIDITYLSMACGVCQTITLRMVPESLPSVKLGAAALPGPAIKPSSSLARRATSGQTYLLAACATASVILFARGSGSCVGQWTLSAGPCRMSGRPFVHSSTGSPSPGSCRATVKLYSHPKQDGLALLAPGTNSRDSCELIDNRTQVFSLDVLGPKVASIAIACNSRNICGYLGSEGVSTNRLRFIYTLQSWPKVS